MSDHGSSQSSTLVSLRTPQLRSEADIRLLALSVTKFLPREGGPVDSRYLAALLSDIIFSANHSSINLAHRGACCNLLSTLLTSINANTSSDIKNLVWTRQTWIHSFQFALAHFSDSKPKPIKQLLGALILVFKKRRHETETKPSYEWLIKTLSEVFQVRTGSAPPKAYLYAINLALSKEVVMLSDIVPPGYRSQILSWTAHDELGPSLASLIIAITQADNDPYLKDWHQPLTCNFTHNTIVQSCYRHYILPALFSKNVQGLSLFIQSLDMAECFTATTDEDLKAELAMSTLIIARSAGLVFISHTVKSSQPLLESSQIVLPVTWLVSLLSSQSNVGRLGSLNLLFGETSPTEPFKDHLLKIFCERLPVMFADTDADFRSDLLSLVQRIVERIRASSAALSRHKDGRLLAQQHFLCQWSDILLAQLRPCASYQRHSCALQCLKMLVKSGIDSSVAPEFWSKSARSQQHSGFHMVMFGPSARTVLLGLLTNPFDDIRALAMFILRAIGADSDGQEASLRTLSLVIATSEAQSSKSGRADLADGVARTYALTYFTSPQQPSPSVSEWWSCKPRILNHVIDNYKLALSAAEDNMSASLPFQLLHSTIISIRYMVEGTVLDLFRESDSETSTNPADRILTAIERTWSSVRSVLCNDAPEGFVPDEPEEEDNDMDSKNMLSFCWRALKEASLLQRTLMSHLSAGQTDPSRILSIFKHQLDLSFVQLIELRHRGAFSTVAQTFLTCCDLFVQRFPEDKETIPAFYKRVVSSIRNASTINTRRSAGLPAALAGILSSSESSDLFATAANDLTSIAHEKASFPVKDHQALPQVHALNCLRELFKHSKLGPRSEEFIPQCLSLAGQCLTSDLWGIRNSGLILFRALIDRLLGTNDSYEDDLSRSRATELFIRLPELLDLVLALLDTDSIDSSTSVEQVFPALQILQRVRPPAHRQDQVSEAVAVLTASSHWHVRDKAAQAYARLHHRDDCLQAWQKCLSWEITNNNALHGQLLCLRYMLKQQRDIRLESARQISESIENILDTSYAQSVSEIITAVAVDLWVAFYAITSDIPSIQPSFYYGFAASWLAGLRSPRAAYSQPQPVRSTSLLIQSMAKAVLYQDSPLPDLVSVVLLLSTSDVDACGTLFVEATNPVTVDIIKPAVMVQVAEAATRLLTANTSPILLQAALRFLTKILAESDLATAALHEERLMPSPDQVLALSTTPLLHDSALILAGNLLEYDLVHSETIETYDALRRWLTLLQLAVHEDQPFDTRFAAAKAVDSVRLGLAKLAKDPNAATLHIDLAMLAYDLANDDDDEIRDLASTSANRLFTSGKIHSPSIPLAASSALLHRLFHCHRSNPHLLTLSLSKLTDSFTPLTLPTQDPTLFAREKQNLFLDPAREAKTFSRLALRMDKSCLSPTSISKLQSWTLAGAATLPDSLAWPTFTADGYVLVLRVIYAAEVLLVWRRKHGLGGINSAGVRKVLVGMVEGLKMGHPLLFEEASRVLCEELLQGAERVGARLGVVPMP